FSSALTDAIVVSLTVHVTPSGDFSPVDSAVEKRKACPTSTKPVSGAIDNVGAGFFSADATTVTVTVSACLPRFPIMRDLPVLIAVTIPVPETAATVASELVHVTPR